MATGIGYTLTDGAKAHLPIENQLQVSFYAEQTTNFTLSADMLGCIVPINSATGVTVTIPAQATTDLGLGFNCLLLPIGAGQVTLSGSGFTVNTPGSLLSSASTYSRISLVKGPGTNVWYAEGAMA